MIAGGVSESIAHFIGYIHLVDDFVRSRPQYENGPNPQRPLPWAPPPVHEPPPARPLDELPSQPIRLDYKPGDFELIGVGRHHVPAPPISAFPAAMHPPPLIDLLPPVPGGGGGARGIGMGIAEPLPPVPDQESMVLTQLNMLHSNNTFLMVPGTDVIALHSQKGLVDLNGMIETAQSETPNWLPQSNSHADLVNTVTAYDADRASHPDVVPVATPNGVYVDSVLQPAGATLDQPLPTLEAPAPETSHNGLYNPGLEANTGGNIAVNSASILDDHTQHTGLVVFGDVHTTDAIVQLNILFSHAQIDVGGATLAQDISTDGNTTYNGASFAQHDTASPVVEHFSLGTKIQVDQINGNFYDVKGLEQTNYLSNNDVVVHATMNSYYQVDSGNNTQVNDLPLSELNQNYDLIVVNGSFHNANVILQQNVLYNDDIAKVFTARSDTA
jgi:hypothetical protein